MEMGCPTYLNHDQIQILTKASELLSEAVDLTQDENGINIDVLLQPHSAAVISLVIEN